MTKNTKIVIGVVLALVPVVIILGILNFREAERRLTYHIYGSFRVIMGDETVRVTLDDMVNMGLVTFESDHRRAEGNFTGVRVSEILAFTGFDYSGVASIAFFSYDGFSTGISLADAMSEGSFIIFEQDGLSLAENPNVHGNRRLWGYAPFQLVLLDDMFPQRWARYLIEIVLQ
ncbi:MAG: hypothetical protein FWB74_04660 [Defluviitaleaceae bacterium]|nr:hypothetical protein [Defluviitaleaceae bacterium]